MRIWSYRRFQAAIYIVFDVEFDGGVENCVREAAEVKM